MAEVDQFILEIKLGNDAMQTPWDVSQALQPLAELFWGGVEWPMSNGIIRDANGNTVGKWEVRNERLHRLGGSGREG